MLLHLPELGGKCEKCLVVGVGGVVVFPEGIDERSEFAPTLMSLEKAELLAEWEIEFFGKLLVGNDEFRGQAGKGSAD